MCANVLLVVFLHDIKVEFSLTDKEFGILQKRCQVLCQHRRAQLHDCKSGVSRFADMLGIEDICINPIQGLSEVVGIWHSKVWGNGAPRCYCSREDRKERGDTVRCEFKSGYDLKSFAQVLSLDRVVAAMLLACVSSGSSLKVLVTNAIIAVKRRILVNLSEKRSKSRFPGRLTSGFGQVAVHM